MNLDLIGTLADEAYELLLWADKLTTEELDWLTGLAGRNYGPEFLQTAWSEGKVKAETVADLIGGIWSGAEFPDRLIDHDDWRYLFQVAGYTVDGVRQLRPTEPRTLYRGAVPERRTDWSWTWNRDVAERFAAGIRGRATGVVWRCTVPPAHMLAVNTGREEDEIVVDTRGLRIVETTGARAPYAGVSSR